MSAHNIALLLQQYRSGDDDAFHRLVPLVYEDLRALARRQLRWRRPGQTLDTTALVHEAFLRLANNTIVDLRDREHFLAVAARAMRYIVIDCLREKQAAKRGGGDAKLSLDEVLTSAPERGVDLQDLHHDLQDLHHALERLSALDGRLVRVVECRYFAGLTEDETGRALGVSARPVQREWRRARAWLREEMQAR